MDKISKLRPELQALKDLFDPRKRELKNIRELVKHDPSYVKELLGVIEDGLDDFKYQCELDKSQLASQALIGMIGLLLDYKKIAKINSVAGKRKFCIMVIDTILYHYPNGYPFHGSPNDKQFVDTFCTFYFHENIADLHGSHWEKETKDCHEYMCKLKEQWISIQTGETS